MTRLVFLKFGGSLITDKNQPHTPRLDVLDKLVEQVAEALRSDPDLQLVLGHGSGSFGHVSASQYQTRRGVSGPEAWRGFSEVWYQAAALNRLVMDALQRVDLPALALAPVSAVATHDRRIVAWNLAPLQAALTNHLVPVIYGDVVFDDVRGGTILSTEDLFVYLASRLSPQRILLAGLEAGVWADFPARTRLIDVLTPQVFAAQAPGLGEAAGPDVTGGMHSKVTQMLALVEKKHDLQALIFSGLQPENVLRALMGINPGTLIRR